MPTVSAITLLAKGTLLGLGAAVPIGPVNVEIARRTLRQGFVFGLAIGSGAVTVDVVYAIVASVGWAPLIGHAWVTYLLGTAGVLLLLYLAAICFRGVFAAMRATGAGDRFGGVRFGGDGAAAIGAGPSIRSTYVTGLLMTFFNPMTLAFWFVVLPAMAMKLTDDPRHDLPFLCAGVFIGAWGWCFCFAGALSILGRFRRDLWAVVADAVGGVVLLGFAVVAAARMIAPLFK